MTNEGRVRARIQSEWRPRMNEEKKGIVTDQCTEFLYSHCGVSVAALSSPRSPLKLLAHFSSILLSSSSHHHSQSSVCNQL